MTKLEALRDDMYALADVILCAFAARQKIKKVRLKNARRWLWILLCHARDVTTQNIGDLRGIATLLASTQSREQA
jgi:hypothetical protein